MSHSFHGSNTHFHYNSDFSGAVTIVSLYDGGKVVEVDGQDLLEFVAYSYIVPKKINQLEDADWRELLDG